VSSLQGRVALITGAGSGIGRASAHCLAMRGYRLALAGRREDALEETAAICGETNCLVVPADVSDEAAVSALFGRTVEKYGRLDLLFNNAGATLPPTPVEDVKIEDWQKLVAVNFTGAFLCLRAAFRIMKDQFPMGGRIINNGSLSAHVPRLFSIVYSSTKHAVTGLTKAASLDGRRYDIACGQIDIGNSSTALSGSVEEGALQPDGNFRAEPTISVEQVAEAVAYMDSLPVEANVQFMTLMATKMPFIGRG
jgi:NAD(P)-dependent dehydrogenase (short-subunit alcohol dehydrogenase family)